MSSGNSWRLLCVLLLALAMPAAVHAQSTISGLVADPTGAVLPGVTVEAASDALIEKVRSVFTDEQGRYTIVNLSPGTYAVTFTLSGFNSVKREGLIVAANTTVPVNAELKIGAMEETITVTGASPVVDVQSVGRKATLDRQQIDVLPTTRNPVHMMSLVPGIKLDVSRGRAGASGATDNVYATARGLGVGETIWKVDGMDVRTTQSSGLVNNRHNEAMMQEVTYQSSAVGIEGASGGVMLNMIPREGGNRFSGGAFAAGNSEAWVSDAKVTDDLLGRGYVGATTRIGAIVDTNLNNGGPLVRDRLWYFGSWRRQQNRNYPANTYDQGEARNSSNWWLRNPQPDWTPSYTDQVTHNASLRLTGQLSQSQKVTAYMDRVFNHITGSDPAYYEWKPSHSRDYTAQAKYTNTISSRLLFETGLSLAAYNHVDSFSPLLQHDRYSPAWYATATRTDLDTGRLYNAGANGLDTWEDIDGAASMRRTLTTQLSYITGSHTVKTGMTIMNGFYREDSYLTGDLVQVYNAGRPVEVQAYNTPSWEQNNINIEFGAYVGDTWSLKRMTVNAGIRFDRWKGSIPEYSVMPGRFVPNRTVQPHMDFPAQNNISPRMGLAYDVFGNARTALKFSFGKYLANVGEGTIENFNSQRLAAQTLTWNDANGDSIAQDSEIENIAAVNPNFGTATASTMSPEWKRGYNYETTAGVQHQVLQGLGVNVMWYRRQLYNLTRVDNILIKESDWIPTSVVSPVDGALITIYNLPDNLRGLQRLVSMHTADSDIRREVYNGIEFSFDGRIARTGTRVFGGWTPEKNVLVTCDNWDLNTRRFCDQSQLDIPWRHEFKVSGTQRLPLAIDASIALISMAGTPILRGAVAGPTWRITRTLTYPNSCVGPCTPGAFVVNAPRLNAPAFDLALASPGTNFYDRYNQLNFSMSRQLNLTTTHKLRIGFDVFNLHNANTVITEEARISASYRLPRLTMEPRIFRLSARLTF